jgi:hypothetical protein
MRETSLTMSDPVPPFDELPELMASLRIFGSRRRLSHAHEALADQEARFLAPLLDARRAAANAVSRIQVVAAFDSRRIAALVDATLRAFAAERFQTRPPARRAFEAELFEIVEPLRVALRELRERAEEVTAAREPAAEYALFTEWLEQLRAAFRAADASWLPLAEALATSPPIEPANSRRGRAP